MAADTDKLQAELASIRVRAEQITDEHDEADCDLNGETCTGHDAVRLLEAVGAILARHVPKTVTVRHLCGTHAAKGYPGRPATPNQVDACPDCTTTERASCAACDPVCPDDNMWPCADVEAIASALLGENSIELVPGTVLTGASGEQYIVGEPIGLAPEPGTPCDAAEFGGIPSINAATGECRCVVCPRCRHHTGNAHQGHYWGYCQVARTVLQAHFCCPTDPGCELTTGEANPNAR